MPQKEPQRAVYRTARGQEVDMLKMIKQNEMTPAVGNARVNARGDKLGPDGKPIQYTPADFVIPAQTTIAPEVVEQIEAPAPTVAKGKKDIANMDPEGNE